MLPVRFRKRTPICSFYGAHPSRRSGSSAAGAEKSGPWGIVSQSSNPASMRKMCRVHCGTILSCVHGRGAGVHRGRSLRQG